MFEMFVSYFWRVVPEFRKRQTLQKENKGVNDPQETGHKCDVGWPLHTMGHFVRETLSTDLDSHRNYRYPLNPISRHFFKH